MVIKGEERKEFVRAAAAQCMVLLKNEGGALPLPQCRVAVFGIGQIRTVKGGTGSGEVNNVSNVSILDGLRACPALTIYEPLAQAYEEYDRAHPQPVKQFPQVADPSSPEMPLSAETAADAAAHADAAIVVISRVAGEGGDRKIARGDYLLQQAEVNEICTVCDAFAEKPVVLLLNVCGVTDLSEVDARVRAILYTSLPGQEAGNAIADILTGAIVPSGHLTDTWPLHYSDCPAQDFGTERRNGNVLELPAFPYGGGTAEQAEIHYNEGIFMGYRGYDAYGRGVAYPFGFGLSYTTFSIVPGAVSLSGTGVRVRASVKNTGDRFAGRAVVQVYASQPRGRLKKAPQILAGFAKTAPLAPGETAEVDVSFDLAELASYDMDAAAWVLEAGRYDIRVGAHSRDTARAGVLELSEEVIVRRGQNLFDGWQGRLMPETPEFSAEAPDGAAIPVDPAAFRTEALVYEEPDTPEIGVEGAWTLDDVRAGRCTLDDLTACMTTEELAALCCGRGMGPVGDMAFNVGCISLRVAGSAGQTHDFEAYGIPPLILADGPAGLRLTQSVRDDNGNETLQQNCTAYPVGTLLASSWDTELAHAIGRSVGEEMRELNVDLWLAPGMNLHRNPLCGRNFEYYSEDPLVTGLMAAAVTRGVQSCGVGVTLKHFAANSQEELRELSNSVADEQTLRELYLRGFELAVKLGRPWAIMTSYNDLNGTPAADNFGLCTLLARCEWGFDGLIMTDWGGGMSTPAISVCVGNDMMQPGGEAEAKALCAAIESGERAVSRGLSRVSVTPTRDDLRRAAARILRVVLKRYPDPAAG